MTLQRGRIFGLVLFKRRVGDKGVGSARQSLEQEQEEIPGPVQNI